MSITPQFLVSVDIPDEVYSEFGHLPEYERKMLEATKGSDSAGQNSYSTVEEWAIFGSLREAQECEKRIKYVIQYFLANKGGPNE